jgi:hypothetical protein
VADDDEISPGGSAILRHRQSPRGWSPPQSLGGEDEIEAHFARYFGQAESVFHEIVSDLVHIDVHVVRPTEGRPWWTLFTTGMSAMPMTVPEGAEPFAYGELVLLLPPEWRVDLIGVTPPAADLERWYWPIRWLKTLARLPHEHQTWLGMGHTVPNGDPPQPFADNTKMCCWMLVPPVMVPEEARAATLSDGRVVNVYCLHGLYVEEVSLKLNQGAGALLDAFDAAGVTDVLRPDRPPAVRKKLFGLF